MPSLNLINSIYRKYKTYWKNYLIICQTYWQIIEKIPLIIIIDKDAEYHLIYLISI